jgi:hypothetical protein
MMWRRWWGYVSAADDFNRVPRTSRFTVIRFLSANPYPHLISITSGAVPSEDDYISDDEQVLFCPQETVQRFLRLANHRFVLIERYIEQHWYPSQVAKCLAQAVISRIGRVRDRLHRTPSTRVTAGTDFRFFSRIWKTCIMNGTASPSSNDSVTASSRTGLPPGPKARTGERTPAA